MLFYGRSRNSSCLRSHIQHELLRFRSRHHQTRQLWWWSGRLISGWNYFFKHTMRLVLYLEYSKSAESAMCERRKYCTTEIASKNKVYRYTTVRWRLSLLMLSYTPLVPAELCQRPTALLCTRSIAKTVTKVRVVYRTSACRLRLRSCENSGRMRKHCSSVFHVFNYHHCVARWLGSPLARAQTLGHATLSIDCIEVRNQTLNTTACSTVNQHNGYPWILLKRSRNDIEVPTLGIRSNVQ